MVIPRRARSIIIVPTEQEMARLDPPRVDRPHGQLVDALALRREGRPSPIRDRRRLTAWATMAKEVAADCAG